MSAERLAPFVAAILRDEVVASLQEKVAALEAKNALLSKRVSQLSTHVVEIRGPEPPDGESSAKPVLARRAFHEGTHDAKGGWTIEFTDPPSYVESFDWWEVAVDGMRVLDFAEVEAARAYTSVQYSHGNGVLTIEYDTSSLCPVWEFSVDIEMDQATYNSFCFYGILDERRLGRALFSGEAGPYRVRFRKLTFLTYPEEWTIPPAVAP
jgi:hypothetical protein